MLQKRIDEIKKTIPEAVQLIAVTKTYPVETINEAIDCGITDIGENKVQEILAKYDKLKPVRIHLIGHLQTNKVKQVIDKVDMIHSLDSLHLAEEINKRAMQCDKIMDVLIQVNAAGEEQKFGVSVEELPKLAEEVSRMPNLRLRGLMHIAPAADNPEDVRKYFKQLKDLFDELKPGFGESFDTLSMGMSNDYMIAIEEGATCVRIGTALFGQRDYTVK